jgi:hypothetical protein
MVLLLFGDVADSNGGAHRTRKIVEAVRSLEQRYGSALGILARNDAPARIELRQERRGLRGTERRYTSATGNARFLR